MKEFLSRSLFVLVAICLLFGAANHVFASEYEAESVFASVSAGSYCLMDADTLTVLCSSGEDRCLPMASTTKVMTCVVALEHMPINTKVKVSPKAVGIEGSSVYLTAGEELLLSHLLYALMLESANDAAVAIAIAVAGSQEAFCDLMNETAARIGLQNTSYANPHGLQADSHYSTARDLCILMAYAMENPAFAEITATKSCTIPAPDEKTRYLSNHNRLLRDLSTCIGGKTGFTKAAGRCLVTASQAEDKRLVCATLGAPDDWRDHKKLYEYGFSRYEMRKLSSKGDLMQSIPVVGGVITEVTACTNAALSMSLLPAEIVSYSYEAPHFLYAPVQKNAYVGDVVVEVNGKERARLPLYTEEGVEAQAVKPGFFRRIWEFIKSWFK